MVRNNETIGDIVADMREIAKDPECVAPTGLAHLAGRIEAARKRERGNKEPPRNCDVGTAEEQHERFVKFCHRANEGFCAGCPIMAIDGCEFIWAQMPYEEGGAE